VEKIESPPEEFELSVLGSFFLGMAFLPVSAF
jgi:hypothetical protein